MNNQEIFTPEERNENLKRRRELIDLVVSGEAVLMVGAGSSARVGYVTWDGLLEELENLATQCGEGFETDNLKRKEKPLEYVENIKSHIAEKIGSLNRYHNCLYGLFKQKSSPCDDFHKMLVSLPFRGILTTNYDTVLEAALGTIYPESASDNSLVIDESSAARVHEFLMSMNNDKRMTKRIAHLHGMFYPTTSIILSIEDYRSAYGLNLTEENLQQSESKLRFRLLWAVLATRRVVFVGFSMDDPYLKKILEVVTEDLWTWNKSTHYAIMDISSKDAEDLKDKAKMLDMENGVSTVFYEDVDGSHKGLEQIIEEINEVCEIRSQPIADQEDWLEQINQNMERGIGNEN
ncbi:hypothetical protein C6501_13030 [Candidatus Poribacteria bacterium]|nr:MAG: hypothetical protein C6501_13030 [Candidatus Poribacteria bacterium]